MKNKLNQLVKKSTILSYVKLGVFKKKWRKHNRHNFTVAKNSFDSKKVFVGKGTYGDLDVRHFGSNDEKLLIGNYCSIAPEVVFVLGGEHRYDTISTFPFGTKYGLVGNESIVKGPIVVEDDVWIGFRSTIMSGVTLGKGSVIAAGAVVTKDVPPYAIVGGVPAKIIKYRFSSDVIGKIQNVNYEKLDKTFITKNISRLSEGVTATNVEEIIRGL